MPFSKTFGYALRAILFVALSDRGNTRIRVDEIASQLSVPKHFLSKIIKRMAKQGILKATKGPYGGISLNDQTLSMSLMDLLLFTDPAAGFDNCVLRLSKCNLDHPCPLHYKMETINRQLHSVLVETSIGDLLRNDQPDFIKSIATL